MCVCVCVRVASCLVVCMAMHVLGCKWCLKCGEAYTCVLHDNVCPHCQLSSSPSSFLVYFQNMQLTLLYLHAHDLSSSILCIIFVLTLHGLWYEVCENIQCVLCICITSYYSYGSLVVWKVFFIISCFHVNVAIFVAPSFHCMSLMNCACIVIIALFVYGTYYPLKLIRFMFYWALYSIINL